MFKDDRVKKSRFHNRRFGLLAIWILLLPVMIVLGGCNSMPGFSSGISDSDSATVTGDPQVRWLDSFAEALQFADESGKPILVNFTGSDWCRYCIKLTDEVFLTPEFESWADENVVLLELDFPRQKILSPELRSQNQQLARQFGVSAYPTILFLDSEGNPVGSPMGYQRGGPTRWIAEAETRIR